MKNISQRKSKPIKKLLERDIQKLITKYLELRRVPFAVTNAERVWNPQGFVRKSKVSPDHPDLSATLPVLVNGNPLGLSFYIEVKTPTGSIRDGQKVKLRELADAGALCVLARSLDEVKDVVEKFQGAELDWDAFKRTRTLLELLLSDRRSKEVKAALLEIRNDADKDKQH